MTIEFAYEKDPGAKLYVNVQSHNNWRDLISLSHGTDGVLQVGGGKVAASGKVNVTVHLHKASSTADVYVNGSLVVSGFTYKYGADYGNAGKLGFTLQKGSAADSGVTLYYVRYMETAQYANIALAKDKATLDADALMESLPADQSVPDADLAMPDLGAAF